MNLCKTDTFTLDISNQTDIMIFEHFALNVTNVDALAIMRTDSSLLTAAYTWRLIIFKVNFTC